jgi:hypothetical protein
LARSGIQGGEVRLAVLEFRNSDAEKEDLATGGYFFGLTAKSELARGTASLDQPLEVGLVNRNTACLQPANQV